jgi:hypothetical protein
MRLINLPLSDTEYIEILVPKLTQNYGFVQVCVWTALHNRSVTTTELTILHTYLIVLSQNLASASYRVDGMT